MTWIHTVCLERNEGILTEELEPAAKADLLNYLCLHEAFSTAALSPQTYNNIASLVARMIDKCLTLAATQSVVLDFQLSLFLYQVSFAITLNSG